MPRYGSTTLIRILSSGLTLALPLQMSGMLFAQDPNNKGEERVSVSMTLSGDYQSDETLGLLDKAMDTLPARKLPVKPGMTLSELILQTYGFGQKNSPASYQKIEKAVLALNGLEKPTDLSAGTILVPTLPYAAKTKPNPLNRFNAIPRLTTLSAEPAPVVTRTGLLVQRSPKRSNTGRIGAALETLWLKVPLSRLRELIQGALGARIKVHDTPITLAFDPSECAQVDQSESIHKVLTDPERDLIRSLTVSPGHRPSTVFVLDSGWPSPGAQKESLEFLAAFFGTLRDKDHLKLPIKRLPDLPFQEPENKHVKAIEASLAEFRTLDSNRRVQVIYVPATRTQGAEPVLREFVFLNAILGLMAPEPGLDKPTKDILNKAEEQTRQVMDRLPVANSGSTLRTDKAILDAILRLTDWSYRRQGACFVLSQSWTVNCDTLKPDFPTHPVGVMVAAAGNIPHRNIYEPPAVDFAQRSIGYQDTVAVLNMARNATEVQCSSSVIAGTEEDLRDAAVVAFDGKVTDAICGTSFAVPRFAWLLALREAYRSESLPPQYWGDRLRRELISLRRGPPVSGFWVDPASLLKSVQPK